MYLFLGVYQLQFPQRFGATIVQGFEKHRVGVVDGVPGHLVLFLLENHGVLHVLGGHTQLGSFRVGNLLQVRETTHVGAVDQRHRQLQSAGVGQERSTVAGVVHDRATATKRRVALVAEERQRLAGVDRTPSPRPARRHVHARRQANWTTHGAGRSRRRQRGQGDDPVPGEVAHLAMRALARRADRVLARGAVGDQLHHGSLAATTPATDARRPRRIAHRGAGRTDTTSSSCREAGRAANVRPAGAGAQQLFVARATECVETRQRP